MMVNAQAQVSNKATVIFQLNVSETQVEALLTDWENAGVAIVMHVPFLNGAVVSLPETISITELATNPIVERIEADQKMGIS